MLVIGLPIGYAMGRWWRLQAFFTEGKSNEVVLNDLFWALLNAKEFMFNH